MKTLLVPVDFSAASHNAVTFAAEWSKKYGYERIILLKTFYYSMFENIIVSAEYTNVNQDNLNRQREDARERLNDLCKTLAEKTGPGIKVTTAISEMPLLRSTIEIIQNEKADLIILGSVPYTDSGSGIITDNIISIAKASPIRVLVVPQNYSYRPVEQVLLPYNFSMLKDLDRLNSLLTSSHWNDFKLLVLDIDTSQRIVDVQERFYEAEDKFKILLKNFKYEIHYTTDKNLINSITRFTKEHSVQLIIALPGKHSFLYKLTHASISEAIYRNAYQPVLILK